MSQKINEKKKLIHDAYGVTIDYIDNIGKQMADICAEAQIGREPSGFIAKRVQETFSKNDLEIIATMFLIKVINEESDKNALECQCPDCKKRRGESTNSKDMTAALQKLVSEQFPELDVQVLRVPREPNGKTNC